MKSFFDIFSGSRGYARGVEVRPHHHHHERNAMKRLKTCLWSLAALAACGGYVFMWFRHNLDDVDTLMVAIIAGVVALASFAYALVSPTVHHRVTKILAGCGALVATFCAGSFLYYSWTERLRLQDMGILAILVLFSVLASGAAVLAWIAFWRCKWSGSYETTDAA
jgi:drug/metabolite transporter (DMT)-like permease